MGTSTKSEFGLMSTNLAAALGIRMATKTVNFETETLDQQCKLQEEYARELGGYVNKGTQEDPSYQVNVESDGNITTGLLGMELNTQINAAKQAGQAIESEAFGTLGSAIVGTVGVLGTLGTLAGVGKLGGSKDLEGELDNLKGFKTELNSTSEDTDIEMRETNPNPVEENRIEGRISKWTGNDVKDPDFSDYDAKDTSSEEAILNKKAMQRLREDPRRLHEVAHNVDREILKREQKVASLKTEQQNTFVNIVSQTSNAGQSYSQYDGKLHQGAETTESQMDNAYGSVLEKTTQTVTQQFSNAGQQANTRQSEIANTLQNIAFPA